MTNTTQREAQIKPVKRTKKLLERGVWASTANSLIKGNCAMMPKNDLTTFRQFCRANSLRASAKVQPDGLYLVWIPLTPKQ